MILFTHGDELEDLDETTDEHLQNHADLERLQKIEGMKTEKYIMKRRRSESKDIPDIDLSGESPAEDHDEINVVPERKDLRLVLLGKTGVGKSATGNTIIGRNVFKSSISSNSETKQCQSETTERISKQISVIDTPGLYDTKLSEEEILTEIAKCITYSSPGPHAFIIVIKVGRFTEEEKNTIKELKEVFGEEMEKYTMIIFTHKDQLENKNTTIEQFLQDSDPDLKELVESCGNRFFCLDNESAGYPQIKDLMSKIEKMVEENGGHFTNEMFAETEIHIREIQKLKLNEKVKQYELQLKRVTQSEWQKIYRRLEEESRREALNGAVAHLYLADYDQLVTISEEKESAIKEAESKGIRRKAAVRLAFRATGKLAKEKMCRVQ